MLAAVLRLLRWARSGHERVESANRRCAKADCTERVTLNECCRVPGLRTHSTWFVIAPADEHFFPEVERVVAMNGHYWVVEKHNGAARIPEELDPR